MALRWSSWYGCAGLLVAAWVMGCGKGTGDPDEVCGDLTTVTVYGRVSYRGDPLCGVRVTFDPSNYKRPNAQSQVVWTDQHGHYQVTTLVGGNSIRVSGVEGVPLIDIETRQFHAALGDNRCDLAFHAH